MILQSIIVGVLPRNVGERLKASAVGMERRLGSRVPERATGEDDALFKSVECDEIADVEIEVEDELEVCSFGDGFEWGGNIAFQLATDIGDELFVVEGIEVGGRQPVVVNDSLCNCPTSIIRSVAPFGSVGEFRAIEDRLDERGIVAGEKCEHESESEVGARLIAVEVGAIAAVEEFREQILRLRATDGANDVRGKDFGTDRAERAVVDAVPAVDALA